MLEIFGISKHFGEKLALDDVSFTVQLGEIVALLGPSGCGKSTLLGLIAGLDQPDQGSITWEGLDMLAIPPHRRGFGLMFQDYALFPHLNAFDNVAFGLEMQSLAKAAVTARVNDMLALVGLPASGRRDVHTLSGGEQQRVALARSLAPQPRLLMLDEPLGSLDRNLRERLTAELGTILRAMRQTAVYVTHDLQEAFTIADRVVLMNAGRIEQIGTPQELYACPQTVFAARFLGLTNLFVGRVADERVWTPLGDFPAPDQPDGPVTLLLRPEGISLEAGGCALRGKVVESRFLGNSSQVILEGQGFTWAFSLHGAPPPSGQILTLYFDPQQSLQFLPFQELSSGINHLTAL